MEDKLTLLFYWQLLKLWAEEDIDARCVESLTLLARYEKQIAKLLKR